MIYGEWPRMAKQGMGKSMGNRECEWVGARLPLWVDNGDRNGSAEAHGDRGDLTARERRQIERHLVDCARCRHHRMALEQALGALAVAATHLPVLSEAPSLWPLLERRIANRDADASGRWPQVAAWARRPDRFDPGGTLIACGRSARPGRTIRFGKCWPAETNRNLNRNDCRAWF